MRKLTPEGEAAVAEIANRHGVSVDAVKTLLEAVTNGGGTMAQFNHPELGGGGQWLRGGMTMVGDMFNHSLKAKVDAICSELSERLAGGGFSAPSGGFQSQSQGGGGGLSGTSGSVSFFAQDTARGSGHWWPAGLGNPSATGAQNTVRYAFFPEKGRLAIDHDGKVEVYDTLDHLIQGFGQQQGGGSSLTFTSQHGLVRIDSLPLVGGTKMASGEAGAAWQSAPAAAESPERDTVFATLERLAALKEKGILNEEEFATKKAELLKRL
jgi:Short C-terminal domain